MLLQRINLKKRNLLQHGTPINHDLYSRKREKFDYVSRGRVKNADRLSSFFSVEILS